jgi:glycosyltransferase involved in cell wall biosynthesis
MFLRQEPRRARNAGSGPDARQIAKPLRILMISSSYFPKRDGSVLAVADLVRSLTNAGNRVVQVTRGYPSHNRPSAPEPNVIRVIQLGNSVASKFLFSISEFIACRKLMQKENFDVIHAHGFSSLVSAEALRILFGTPVVFTFHGLQGLWSRDAGLSHKLRFLFSIPYEGFVARRADAVAVQSRLLGDVVSKLYGVSWRKLAVVSNPVDIEQFDYAAPQDSKIVLFVGTLGRVHSPDLIVRAMRDVIFKVPEARLVIVGEGPSRSYLMELAKQLGLEKHVELVGRITNRAELSSLYAKSRVVVVPFKAGGYILSLVVMEGMAVGRPVVTTMTLDKTDGVIGCSYDAIALAQSITKVLQMPRDEYERLSRAARRFVESECSNATVMLRMTNLYRDLAQREELQA